MLVLQGYAGLVIPALQVKITKDTVPIQAVKLLIYVQQGVSVQPCVGIKRPEIQT